MAVGRLILVTRLTAARRVHVFLRKRVRLAQPRHSRVASAGPRARYPAVFWQPRASSAR